MRLKRRSSRGGKLHMIKPSLCRIDQFNQQSACLSLPSLPGSRRPISPKTLTLHRQFLASFRANDDSGVPIRTSCIKNDLRQARLNFCSHTPRFLSLVTEVNPYETRDPKRSPTVCNSPARRWNPGRHGGYAGHRRLALIRRRTHALDSVDSLQVIYHQRCPRDLLSHSEHLCPPKISCYYRMA